MPLTPVLLFVAHFIMITPVLAVDEAREQEITPKIEESRQFDDWLTQEDTKIFRGLATSRALSPCFCGVTSLKCCIGKRALAKIEEAGTSQQGTDSE